VCAHKIHSGNDRENCNAVFRDVDCNPGKLNACSAIGRLNYVAVHFIFVLIVVEKARRGEKL
jgi:hypothetical protein